MYIYLCVYPGFEVLRQNACLCAYSVRGAVVSIFCKRISLSDFVRSSSQPFRGAGERGRQVRGGDGSEADAGGSGLRGEVKNAEGKEGGGGVRCGGVGGRMD